MKRGVFYAVLLCWLSHSVLLVLMIASVVQSPIVGFVLLLSTPLIVCGVAFVEAMFEQDRARLRRLSREAEKYYNSRSLSAKNTAK